MKFSQLDKELQEARCVIPQHVSITQNPDEETTDQIIDRQNKFISLPDNIKVKLSSWETGEKIKSIGKKFDLEILQMASISRTIRAYYFGETKKSEFEKIFFQEMKIDQEKARLISHEVAQKIIDDFSFSTQNLSKTEKIPLGEALGKYPELGEQIITSEKIKLKSLPDPARPSIKNWIFDYTFNSGHGAHNSMERGTYLFQNENAKKLTSAEREKLAFLLRAYDENTPVEINVELKQLVFPKKTASPENKVPQAVSSQSTPVPQKTMSGFMPKNDFHRETPPPAKSPFLNSVKPIEKSFEKQGEEKKSSTSKLGSHLPQRKILSSGKNFSFSSPQKMPFEKEASPEKQTPAAPPAPKNPEPIRIIPRDFKKTSDNRLSVNLKNVVDLKN